MTDYSRRVYKKDSKGKIRVLHVYTEGADMIQSSGLVDGAKVEHRTTCKGKNIGKSNETTPEEQARKEAEAKIETKLSTGYFDTIEETEVEVILPMLAKSYDKEAKKIDWETAYVQPKLDGMRALGTANKQMISRKGKAIDTMSHIQLEVNSTGCADTLDGELYAHGLSFQDNMRLIKKYREGESENVKYHVYDMVLPNLSFSERYLILSKLVLSDESFIKLVPTYKVTSKEDLDKYHAKFLAQGYEGTILRWGTDGYKINGRSSNLLKYKDFKDIACKVIDVVPTERVPEHGKCICELDSKTFGTGMKFSSAEKKDILINKEDYIGKTAEIRFFEYTDDGIPRFPVCVGFRLDK